MTAQTLTLTDFLLARIAEDEAAARDAALVVGGVGFGDERITHGRRWVARYHEVYRHREAPEEKRLVTQAQNFGGGVVADHIARHDPARVLAECEAKRRIVERCSPRNLSQMHESMLADEILWMLALPYADHPDYNPDWRP